MTKTYIIVRGGIVESVWSDAEAMDVEVLDLDDIYDIDSDIETDDAKERLAQAAKLPRVY